MNSDTCHSKADRRKRAAEGCASHKQANVVRPLTPRVTFPEKGERWFPGTETNEVTVKYESSFC